jgi:RNA polymerase sigma factor (sigma-70 family)
MATPLEVLLQRLVGASGAPAPTTLLALRVFVRLRSSRIIRLKERTSDLVQVTCHEVLSQRANDPPPERETGLEELFQAVLSRVNQRRKQLVDELENQAQEQRRARDQGLRSFYARLLGIELAARVGIEAFEDAFDRLSADARELVVLSLASGLSPRSIAERLGKRQDAVRRALTRARLRLLVALDS